MPNPMRTKSLEATFFSLKKHTHALIHSKAPPVAAPAPTRPRARLQWAGRPTPSEAKPTSFFLDPKQKQPARALAAFKRASNSRFGSPNRAAGLRQPPAPQVEARGLHFTPCFAVRSAPGSWLLAWSSLSLTKGHERVRRGAGRHLHLHLHLHLAFGLGI
jgi:hypothetical protein